MMEPEEIVFRNLEALVAADRQLIMSYQACPLGYGNAADHMDRHRIHEMNERREVVCVTEEEHRQ